MEIVDYNAIFFEIFFRVFGIFSVFRLDDLYFECFYLQYVL